MSIKRVAESVDLNLWIPATVEASVDFTAAILRIFRDEGGRKDRQKGRLMWLIEDYGEIKQVNGHPQASEAFRKRVVKEMSTKVEKAQPKATAPFERRSLLGVHPQPQAGKSRVGVHVPVGRISVAEARQIADLADRYSGGEVRLTVEQNVILPNVDDSALQALLAEPSLNGASRLSVEPGNIVGNVVSCTGAQFCGLAMVETKNNAEDIAKILETRVEVPRAVRIHWTGCPNSCGQVQAGDIGLMGGPAKKMNAEGKMKAVPGVKVFVGGTIGEHGKLQLEPTDMNGSEISDGVPIEDLVPVLTQLIVDRHDGVVKEPFVAEHAAWKAALDEADAAKAAVVAAKEAAKVAKAKAAEEVKD